MDSAAGAAVTVRARRRATDLAALVRLPNVFTAPPDVIAGAALAAAAGATVDPLVLGGLCVASALLYAAGTTLNDVADAAEDARDRPGRPIPSGAITRQAAAAVGVGLLAAGVGVAFLTAGPRAGVVATALAVVVGLYNGALKGGPAGYVAMGVARGLNVTLGLSLAGVFAVGTGPVAVPVALAVYVAALTRMAEGETGTADQSSVVVAATATLLVAAVVVAVVGSFTGRATVTVAAAAVFAAAFLAWVGRALVDAYSRPAPETVGPAVGAGVLGIVLLDAATATVVGPVGGLVAAAFLIPSVGFSRRFEVT